MQVLLVEDFPALGYVGDTVQVKSGYARNYLIPRGVAVDVGSRRAREFAHILTGVTAKRTRLKGEAQGLGEQVAKESLSFELKVGSGGKAFGSIGSRDVLKQLNEKGYSFDKKQVRLADTIKAPGEYTATVQLHAEVAVEVAISVAGIKEKKVEDDGAPKRGRGKRGASRRGDDAGSEEQQLDAALEGEELEISAEGDDVADIEVSAETEES